MQERRWFITGISSGIGRSLANLALARGDSVVGTARRAMDVESFGTIAPGRSRALMLDLDDHDGIADAVGVASDAAGPIDIVVNNAGRSLWSPVEDTPLSEAKSLFDTNLFGPMAVMQAFLPHFRARKQGVFVNISSGCGLVGVPGVGAYCASKFALEGLSESLAAEVAGFGIKVMLVEPGAVQSRFISENTREVGRPTADYGPLAQGKSALAAYYQDAAMSSDAVAAAILTQLDTGEIPPRLIIGEDTRASASAKYRDMIQLLAG